MYAIADLHLSLGTDKPMDDFKGWHQYVQRLEQNWRLVVAPEDTVVIAGDISWGMSMEQARPDFAFLNDLPGRKLIIKGNHDYWWATRRKMDAFFEEQGFDTLHILFNDAYAVDNRFAVCGTRGWFFDAEEDADKKVLNREVGRLETSIQAAEKLGLEPIVFLHYPPVYADAVCEDILNVLKKHDIRRCYYGHIHGAGIYRSVNGQVENLSLKLISADALQFMPLRIEE